MKPANIGIRLLARILDGLIVMCPIGVAINLITSAALSSSNSATPSLTGLSSAGLISGLVIYGLYFVYEALMLGSRGQTLGKMIVGLKVIRQQDGQVPGFNVAAIRTAVFPSPGIVPCVGPLWNLVCALSPLFDSSSGYQQGFHDKAAKTMVISTK